MRCPKITGLIFILFFLVPVIAPIVAAQSNQVTSAELSIYPIETTPLIEPNKQATINLLFHDNVGFNYTSASSTPRGWFRTHVTWLIFHPSWKAFLGYSSITFTTSIVGNTPGWVASINPTTIGKSTDGTEAILHLTVTVTDLTAPNTATVRVSATRYSKDGSEYGTSDFDILLRSAPLNFLSIIPDTNSREVAPSAITTFTFNVRNLGYFVDTFAIKINSTDSINAVPSESSFVLQPDQTKQVTLWVMTPETLFDPGTPHTINVSAYSLNYPTKYFSAAVTVVTKGTYVPQLFLFYGILVIILVIIIYFFFFYLREKREKNVYGKPMKPWKLPEEQAHLRELKKTDKKAYDQEMRMMEDEYKSAMLYYQDYRQSLKGKPKEEAPRKEEQTKRSLPRLLKKSEKPPKVEEKKVEAIVPIEDKTKEKALAKIQKEQEKALKRKKD